MNHLKFNDINLMKKAMFKKLVKIGCQKAAFSYLMTEKCEMSKMENLEYDNLKMQCYIKTDIISIRKQKLLFKWRTRMIKVASNYGQIKACPICENYVSLDSQEHLFKCEELTILNIVIFIQLIWKNSLRLLKRLTN